MRKYLILSLGICKHIWLRTVFKLCPSMKTASRVVGAMLALMSDVFVISSCRWLGYYTRHCLSFHRMEKGTGALESGEPEGHNSLNTMPLTACTNIII